MHFDGLGDIDWAGMSHAHGEASNIPALLEHLCSSDPMLRGEVCNELFETVWHQGTIYPASAEILPFLFQIVPHRKEFVPGEVDGQYIPPADEMAVGLICSIFTGDAWLTQTIALFGEEKVAARLESQGRSLATEQALEKRTLDLISETFARNVALLESYCTAPEGLGDIVAEALNKT